MMMRAVVMMAVVAAACGGDAPACPDPALAGGTIPVVDGTPGVYVVEAEQDDVHLTVGYALGVAAPASLPPHEAFAFIAPDRWLRLHLDDDVHSLVQECRRGGTADGGCDEIGPPTHGRLVAYRDGVQIVDALLWTPALPLGEAVEGCPLLLAGHVDPPH